MVTSGGASAGSVIVQVGPAPIEGASLLAREATGRLGSVRPALLGGNRAYVEYEGVSYEVDPTTYNYVKSLSKRQGQGGKSSEVTACQEAAAELEVADFIDNLKDAGSADVGGTTTTKISGDLTDDPDGQAGAREGLPPDDLLR